MADDAPFEPRETPPEPAKEAFDPEPGFFRRHWGKLTVLSLVVVPVAVFAIWAAIALSYSYSSGERVGYVQKLSLKGWLCKTWEGELQISSIPGSAPVVFEFSVRSDSLARVIEEIAGRPVALHYEQHVGVPSKCFGETEYFVTGVREITR
jgi:hypothetical protein